MPEWADRAVVVSRAAGLRCISGNVPPTESQRLCAVLDRVGHHDHLAFTELYTATAARIFGMTMRVLCDRGYAEDVTQEVFVEVWSKAASFDARCGSPLAWMITIAHRRAIDRVRSEQSRTARDQRNSLLSMRRCFDDDVAAEVLAEMSNHRVVACLDCLTDLEREAIVLAYIDRLTYRETAAALDIPVPTAKSRIREGLHRMRHQLEGELVTVG
ncbi:sigma-70 family RNA polymerase sigma factor [Antrihabitans cavernicola]|uniref:sigma-70 family RNA polymerase sigma factor n=1 Tax=Antrihabitans cavernicola TaxID=2495913 RepID=UPI001659EC65|nr:sigma-70 family RNA polymerase sigma factor [Spelaeibacter cavernicola]